ncbi:hypothetical protein MYMAC_001848 [Corallococcus macrosporus DSM 14697]|uniref:Uncharacterized protein n=1 Tax=Corallococcus macrosporus DSM 14697 TaxID=1189310 RepID=A0A250JT22_9BACT|nr:hypothetical protein MYMAC_001848 [Corallococcus macrosporus DSM 14697]
MLHRPWGWPTRCHARRGPRFSAWRSDSASPPPGAHARPRASVCLAKPSVRRTPRRWSGTRACCTRPAAASAAGPGRYGLKGGQGEGGRSGATVLEPPATVLVGVELAAHVQELGAVEEGQHGDVRGGHGRLPQVRARGRPAGHRGAAVARRSAMPSNPSSWNSPMRFFLRSRRFTLVSVRATTRTSEAVRGRPDHARDAGSVAARIPGVGSRPRGISSDARGGIVSDGCPCLLLTRPRPCSATSSRRS